MTRLYKGDDNKVSLKDNETGADHLDMGDDSGVNRSNETIYELAYK